MDALVAARGRGGARRAARRDERIANVVPAWIPEANQIAQSAEFVPYGTLKRKYGNSGQFDALRMLTEDVLMNAQVLL